MLEILERIVAGNGEMSDLDELEELADMIENTALCGLGKSAPKPVVSTIHAFRKEYEEHIVDKKCRAKVCTALRQFHINPEFCIGCGKCVKVCAFDAITVENNLAYIDPQKCKLCRKCVNECPTGAIRLVGMDPLPKAPKAPATPATPAAPKAGAAPKVEN